MRAAGYRGAIHHITALIARFHTVKDFWHRGEWKACLAKTLAGQVNSRCNRFRNMLNAPQ